MHRRSLIAAAAALAPPPIARAQPAWPSRPVRVIATYPAGSSPDIIARFLAEPLAQRLGQPCAVENRVGAGGNVGSDAIAKAPPDGATLGIGAVAQAIAPALYGAAAPDPVRAFTRIALLAEIPIALAVAGDGPYRDLGGFLAAAREKPAALRIGTPGNGTLSHVTVLLLQRMAGMEFELVPTRGTPQAAVEVLSGRVEALVAPSGANFEDGRLRALGIAAPRRLPRYPALPTFREQGFDLVSIAWFDLCAPAGLPDRIADRLHEEAGAIFASPGAAALLDRLGAAPHRAVSRAELAAFVAEEAARWGDLARAAGLRAE